MIAEMYVSSPSLDGNVRPAQPAFFEVLLHQVMKGDPGLIELRRNGVTVTPVSAGVYNIIVPTKTSELQNDSNYQNGSEVASVVGAAVNIEKTRAQAAESALDGRLDTAEDDIDDLEEAVAGINTVIPSAASAQNQVADKAFVNSSIATATATFRGTFASKALLDAYTGEKDSNDYAFVQVIDAVTSLVKQYDRYKWNGTAWVFEYTLNNSSFTQAQWNAINSGLTSSDKTALDNALAFIATFGNIVTHNVSEFATPANVTAEKTRAQAAESALDGRLDAAEDDIDDLEEAVAGINTVIPSAASAQNQVADKAFVNSSIATATATFRGTFASKALLDAYTGEKDSNDYAFVQVIDAVTSLVKQYDRYKWNGTAWVFEYTLNNSSFTQAQWNAINSGLTSSDKTALDTALAFIATFGDIVTHNASEFATPSDIGNGMLTIKQNGVVIGTFAANASAAAVIELINTIYDDTAVKNRLVELEDPVSSVIAAALTLLESRVSAIEKQAREGFPSLIVDELEVRRKFNQFVSAGNSYLRGAGAPAAAVIPVDWDEANFGPWTGIPQFIGQRYLNTSSNKWYTAKGFRAISDWVQDTNA